MNDIIVAGIGPGHPDYMLPAAARAIREAQVLVGGRRALAQFAREGQRTMAVTGDITAVMQFIREALATSYVVVMVSGDPGYYSLLDALRRHFPAACIRVIPGLSPCSWPSRGSLCRGMKRACCPSTAESRRRSASRIRAAACSAC